MSDATVQHLWINGQPSEDIGLSVRDRGLAYGDGVFETIRVTRQPVLLNYHLQRLDEGLRRLSIHLNWARFERWLEHFPGFSQPGVVKITVTRGPGGRGYGSSAATDPTCILATYPASRYPDNYAQHGISVFPCQTRLSVNPVLAGIKHLNRLEQVLARQEWQDQDSRAQDLFQEGLVQDVQSRVIEGVFSNLFAVIDGVICTPDLSGSGIAGVMRRWLLEQFRDRGYVAVVREISLGELMLAEEWFFCNSVIGVWPVYQFQKQTWQVGKVTRLAQQMVSDHWCL